MRISGKGISLETASVRLKTSGANSRWEAGGDCVINSTSLKVFGPVMVRRPIYFVHGEINVGFLSVLLLDISTQTRVCSKLRSVFTVIYYQDR